MCASVGVHIEMRYTVEMYRGDIRSGRFQSISDCCSTLAESNASWKLFENQFLAFHSVNHRWWLMLLWLGWMVLCSPTVVLLRTAFFTTANTVASKVLWRCSHSASTSRVTFPPTSISATLFLQSSLSSRATFNFASAYHYRKRKRLVDVVNVHTFLLSWSILASNRWVIRLKMRRPMIE